MRLFPTNQVSWSGFLVAEAAAFEWLKQTRRETSGYDRSITVQLVGAAASPPNERYWMVIWKRNFSIPSHHLLDLVLYPNPRAVGAKRP